MNITPVKTEKEYKATLKRIEELWNAKEGTPQADEMEVLFTLTEAYEAKHHPIGPPDPAQYIKFVDELVGVNNKTEQMITTNYTAFRKGLKKFLDNVEQNNETVIIKRSTGKGAVLISTDKYNSITETIHLLGHKANAERLYESIIQMKEGRTGRKGVN